MRDQSGMFLAAAQLWPRWMLVARRCPQQPRAVSVRAPAGPLLFARQVARAAVQVLVALCRCWWHCAAGTCPPTLPAAAGHWASGGLLALAEALRQGSGTGTGAGIGTGTWHRH